MPIPEAELFKLVRNLLTFPYPTICRHSVAADTLGMLEEYGVEISPGLARAVVQADDERALALLDELEGR